MRKRRAILYDDDPAILGGLSCYFEELGYEVLAFGEPVECAIYAESDHCDQERPCADVMITDFAMPLMTGLELLERQTRRGCPLDVRNKAVLSGSLSPEVCSAIRELGCATFHKPCRMSTLAAWLLECEQRIDLTQPLGVRRREPREACSAAALLDNGFQEELSVVEVVNRSESGLCLRADRLFTVAQTLKLETPLPLTASRFEVRWTRPDAGGGCCAGVSRLQIDAQALDSFGVDREPEESDS